MVSIQPARAFTPLAFLRFRELIVIRSVDHVFNGTTLEQTREANLKALDATFRFIDKTMNP